MTVATRTNLVIGTHPGLCMTYWTGLLTAAPAFTFPYMPTDLPAVQQPGRAAFVSIPSGTVKTTNILSLFVGGDPSGVSPNTPVQSLVPGQTYKISMHVALGNAALQLRLQVDGVTVVTMINAPTNGVVSAQFTATAATHTLTFLLFTAATQAYSFYFDDVMVEAVDPNATYAGTQDPSQGSWYFDGDFPYAVWAGAPYASQSSATYDMLPGGAPVTYDPQLFIEFNARPPQSWEFTLDSSSLDGNAVLGSSTRYVPMFNRVKSINVERGRKNMDADVSAGTVTVVMDNYDGQMDGDNPASIYRQDPTTTYLRKGMLCRVWVMVGPSSSAAPGRQTVHQWFMISVARLDETPDSDFGFDKDVRMTFVDDLSLAGNQSVPPYDPSFPSRYGENAQQRFFWVMQQLGTQGATINNSAGTVIMLGLSGGGNFRTILNQLANVVAGRVFVDRTGVFRYTGHGAEYGLVQLPMVSDDPADAPSLEAETYNVSQGGSQVYNRVTVDRGTTVAYNTFIGDDGFQTYTRSNDLSISKYGVSDYGTVDAPVANSVLAVQLADYHASRHADMRGFISSFGINLAGYSNMMSNAPDQWWQYLELGARVRVSRTISYVGSSRTIEQIYAVEGLSFEQVGPASPLSLVVYTGVQDAVTLGGDFNPFRLDTSALDGADILAPI